MTITTPSSRQLRATIKPHRAATATAVTTLALALLAGCSSGSGKGQDSTAHQVTASASAVATTGRATSPAPASASASSGFPTSEAAPGAAVPQVRDSFAVLQATYNDTCSGTSGNCDYFLNRLLTNLDDLENSMVASPKGSGHFAQPLTWISQLQHALGSDVSYTNLKRHKDKLVETRDEINTWMQSHPDDYR